LAMERPLDFDVMGRSGWVIAGVLSPIRAAVVGIAVAAVVGAVETCAVCAEHVARQTRSAV